MPSPVDTSVKHFTSKMVNAPGLSFAVGTMTSLLKACLVTGFDLRAATSLTVASGVATMSFSGTAAAVKDAVILVEGVTGALVGLNGEQRVTSAALGTLTFATDEPDGTAAGTISFRMAPLGWENPFTGTNVEVFRSADPLSTRMFVRFDDNQTLKTFVRGYENMTDVNTGVGPFPTVSQRASGGQFAKSANTSTVHPIRWSLVGDGKTFILNVVPDSHTNPLFMGGRTIYTGDFLPYAPAGDAYAFAVTSGATGINTETVGVIATHGQESIFTPRSHLGLGEAIVGSAYVQGSASNAVSGSDPSAGGSFPDLLSGRLALTRKEFIDNNLASNPRRGLIRGYYHIPMGSVATTFNAQEYLPGTGPFFGQTFLTTGEGSIANQSYPSPGAGVGLIDITGPWE